MKADRPVDPLSGDRHVAPPRPGHQLLLLEGGDALFPALVEAMDAAGFGNCSNQYACEAVCPKGISIENIARLNREYMMAGLSESE